MCFNRQFSIFLHPTSYLIQFYHQHKLPFLSPILHSSVYPYYIPSSYMITKSPTHFIKTPTLSSFSYFCFNGKALKKAIYVVCVHCTHTHSDQHTNEKREKSVYIKLIHFYLQALALAPEKLYIVCSLRNLNIWDWFAG